MKYLFLILLLFGLFIMTTSDIDAQCGPKLGSRMFPRLQLIRQNQPVRQLIQNIRNREVSPVRNMVENRRVRIQQRQFMLCN